MFGQVWPRHPRRGRLERSRLCALRLKILRPILILILDCGHWTRGCLFARINFQQIIPALEREGLGPVSFRSQKGFILLLCCCIGSSYSGIFWFFNSIFWCWFSCVGQFCSVSRTAGVFHNGFCLGLANKKGVRFLQILFPLVFIQCRPEFMFLLSETKTMNAFLVLRCSLRGEGEWHFIRISCISPQHRTHLSHQHLLPVLYNFTPQIIICIENVTSCRCMYCWRVVH